MLQQPVVDKLLESHIKEMVDIRTSNKLNALLI